MNLLVNDYLENLSKLLRFYHYLLLSFFVEASLMVAERISPILTGMAITVSVKLRITSSLCRVEENIN